MRRTSRPDRPSVRSSAVAAACRLRPVPLRRKPVRSPVYSRTKIAALPAARAKTRIAIPPPRSPPPPSKAFAPQLDPRSRYLEFPSTPPRKCRPAMTLSAQPDFFSLKPGADHAFALRAPNVSREFLTEHLPLLRNREPQVFQQGTQVQRNRHSSQPVCQGNQPRAGNCSWPALVLSNVNRLFGKQFS